MQRPRNTILIVIVLFAIAVFTGLNMAMNRMDGSGGEPAENEAASEQAPSEPAASTGPVRLPTDETVGPANAPNKVVVGWTWTPEVQGNPQALQDAIRAVQQAAPNAQVRIVNVDASPDVAPGIQVNGQTVVELPESGIVEPGRAAQAVAITLNRNR